MSEREVLGTTTQSGFDADGGPVLYRTAAGEWLCATCLERRGEPSLEALPRSSGVLGRCDGCHLLDGSPYGPSCRDLAEWLRTALLGLELEPVWAELLDGRLPGRREEAARPDGPARGLEVRVGEAIFRCVVERVR